MPSTTTNTTPKNNSNTMASSSPAQILRFEGHLHFRQRLVLATLSSKPVRIDRIRADVTDHENTGLADYEISFLRLMEKMTNGSSVEINYSGTSILYRPGVIFGGKIEHDCPTSRGIGYFLEPLIALAPFAKNPLLLILTGVTNNNVDVCVDTIRTVTLPNLKRFLPTEEAVDLKITRRGAPPLGGGEVTFRCPCVRTLRTLQLTDFGRGIKRIRGIAYATRISPLMANRVVDSARSILTRYIPDVYLYTDIYKGAESGKSPGYGLSLVAESTTGTLMSAECAYQPRKNPIAMDVDDDDEKDKVAADDLSNPESMLENDYSFPTPEDLGVRTARLLLTEIRKGGCVDTVSQWLAVLMLALGPEDVGKVRVGQVGVFTVQYLRDIKAFLGVTFKVTPDNETRTVVLTCVGNGYVNVSKKVQ
ncbi:rRNA-processing endoribonuclease [Phlyctochytrium planicorne]|nr:rRNA-processing endoribonuclease [Phlyctochytrium planicorne]